MSINIDLILASFGGGVFAAALGVIGSFSLCGALILVGIAAAVTTGDNNILNLIAFGPYFGPHISYAGAVAAAAYAGRKQLIDGANILVPLNKLKRFDVLLIGGLFGVLGYLCNELLAVSGIQIDTIAFTVVISNVLVRLVFGKSGFLGRTPKEIKINPGVQTLLFSSLLGFSLGLVSSFATQLTGFVPIGYGISALSLLMLFHDEFPVTHHVAICAAYAAKATGSLIIGGIFGILALLLGNLVGSLFNKNSDTFIDPPALTIAVLSPIIFIFL
ncbi:hypothetical protein [Sinanaerobacter chloroacetimidivorans]|uniref:DUF7973 domain-containing protein n=1 Tax=Sinanaerobacter chloroacetimidivorans TaxID=2818044 RepID=A0A8J7W1D5_9FIRM|nr:hypothetical protein [Sinanaerobacter chloroacetimidivorans]MBR0598609.1 hypothetical protein [Sinanaerobacter chloroacetimidivorans]